MTKLAYPKKYVKKLFPFYLLSLLQVFHGLFQLGNSLPRSAILFRYSWGGQTLERKSLRSPQRYGYKSKQKITKPSIKAEIGAAGGVNDKELSELQSKVAFLENSLRSQRKTLREQAKALEDLGLGGRGGGVRSPLEPEETQSFLGGNVGNNNNNPNIAQVLNSLAQKVNFLVDKENQRSR